MKLRNKKTGEIRELPDGFFCGDNLKKICEEWEDYEEPKEIWWLDNEGSINHAGGDVNDSFRKNRKIGNYFLSREEAELAVRKLKAWKRLKDKGISLHLQKQFRGDGIGYSRTIYTDFTKDSQEIVKDLDLLFSEVKNDH